MKAAFYKALVWISRALGWWAFSLIAWFIAAGYFFLKPQRRGNSVRFYSALFPAGTVGCPLLYAWRQYQSFTNVFMDRIRIRISDDIVFESKGLEHLREASIQKTGGIILMSHAGNWEIAVHLLKKLLPEMDLLLYMGVKNREQIEAIQKQELDQAGIRIIAAGPGGGSPFDLVEGIHQLKKGGFVSITGDTLWHKDQRRVKARFLSHSIALPQAPHLLSLLSGKPLFVFFSFRTGKGKYLFTSSEPLFVQAASRSERNAAIEKSAQRYADILEKNIRKYPEQWYHFDPFLKEKTASDTHKTKQTNS